MRESGWRIVEHVISTLFVNSTLMDFFIIIRIFLYVSVFLFFARFTFKVSFSFPQDKLFFYISSIYAMSKLQA